jgi:predicted TPR repeat methyltransferase
MAPSVSYPELFAQATAAMGARNLEQALQLYERAILADPSQAEAYYKRANVLRELGQLDAAIAGYNQAIERRPDYAFAYCNRGVTEHRGGRMDAALKSFDRAIALEPGDAFAHYNRGLLMQDSHRWEEAIASYDQAIATNPEFADAQFNRAMALLTVGDFARGLPAWEWRWKSAQRLGIGPVRQFQRPLWLGDRSLAGKRLLIHSEQGMGDAIQFCRYAPLCAAQGATVILEAHPALLALLTSLEGVAELVGQGEPLPPFDFHCPIMSLPLALRTTLDTIPAPASYLSADPTRVAHWQSLVGKRTRPRIGLVWSGNLRNVPARHRSIRLSDWAPYLPDGFQYFQLQTEVSDVDREVLEASDRIFSFDEDFRNFAETAALRQCMDLLISIDTSVAHLSGAMGMKTWTLLSSTPDWRWLRDREDSPWYPSMTLYRQRDAADWAPVLRRVEAALRQEFPAA